MVWRGQRQKGVYEYARVAPVLVFMLGTLVSEPQGNAD